MGAIDIPRSSWGFRLKAGCLAEPGIGRPETDASHVGPGDPGPWVHEAIRRARRRVEPEDLVGGLESRGRSFRAPSNPTGRSCSGGPILDLPGMKPILTVAVCTRDDPHRLTLCLEGLALQAWDGVEVVVVNDGGPPLDEVLIASPAGCTPVRQARPAFQGVPSCRGATGRRGWHEPIACCSSTRTASPVRAYSPRMRPTAARRWRSPASAITWADPRSRRWCRRTCPGLAAGSFFRINGCGTSGSAGCRARSWRCRRAGSRDVM